MLPFTVDRSWPVAGQTVALVASGGSVFRLSAGRSLGSDVVTAMDPITGQVLAGRSLPGAEAILASDDRLWVTVNRGPKVAAQIVALSLNNLATRLTLEVPHTADFSSSAGAQENLGELAAAGGRIWVTFGRHFYGYAPATGQRLDDLRESGAGAFAESAVASPDGRRLWTGSLAESTQDVPVEQRDAVTGRVLASADEDAHRFAAYAGGVWAVQEGGNTALPVRLIRTGARIRLAPTYGPEGYNTASNGPSVAVAAGALWLTDGEDVRCEGLATGQIRIDAADASAPYANIVELSPDRLLLTGTDAKGHERLLVATPKPQCLR